MLVSLNQYVENRKTEQPERNLWAAVLRMALLDYARGNKQVVSWIRNKNKAKYSCQWVCDILGIKNIYQLIKAIDEDKKEWEKILAETFRKGKAEASPE